MSKTEWSRRGDAWEFLEVLCGLTAEAWLGIPCRLRSTAAFHAARLELIALVGHGGHALSAWNLTDGVETVAWHMARRVAVSRVMIEAARTAALALLLRQQLGERRFWILYEPFQAVVPQRKSQLQLHRVFTKSLCGDARDETNVQESSSTRGT